MAMGAGIVCTKGFFEPEPDFDYDLDARQSLTI
jgi:hypothetical protein